jgi:hypothetical protein
MASAGTSFIAKLKRTIATRKFIVFLVVLWIYSVVIYYFQTFEILTLRGIAVIAVLGVPMLLAILFTLELAVHRLIE